MVLMSFSGSIFSDNTGYMPGLGTISVLPNISSNTKKLQFGIRNFYGIGGTFLAAISYNQPEFSIQASILNLSSYYRTIDISFAIRHKINKILKGGISFTFNREILPYNKNRILFGISSGISLFPNLNIHTGIYGFPERTRIPILLNISTIAGKTGILIEGEKNLSLKLLLFQWFKISKKISTYISFSTSPNKLSIGVKISTKKIKFEPFSEIHDVLGHSDGIILEYTPFKSYNL